MQLVGVLHESTIGIFNGKSFSRAMKQARTNGPAHARIAKILSSSRDRVGDF
jgi:hypothetical protein